MRSVVRDNGEIVKQFDYAPFGSVIPLLGNVNRTKFIGKEKDKESNYADHGVRKYDDEIGRFTSIDPLWEKYYSLTPYQYAGNNPVSFLDGNGYAQYMVINSDGKEIGILDDGVDDGLCYVTSEDAVNSSSSQTNLEDGKAGPPSINYEMLKCVSYLLSKQTDICLETHISDLQNGEGGGVGDSEHWEYGGKSNPTSQGVANATEQVKIAREIFIKKYGKEPTFFSHDHPHFNSSCERIFC